MECRSALVLLVLAAPALGQYGAYTRNAAPVPAIVFSPAAGTYTGSQTVTITQTYGSGRTIFYTTDGSTPTEASIQYTAPITVSRSQTVKVIVTTLGQAIQNGQTTFANWKTNLASHSAQSSAYAGSYTSPSISYCPDATDNTTSSGCQGVQGIPSAINVVMGNALPTLNGSSKTAEFDFTSSGLATGSTYYGTQILWPYNVGSVGCDTCTSMVQDLYIWPGPGNAAAGRNDELDMNIWDQSHSVMGTGDGTWFGLSFQCSGVNGRWEYNGQEGGWHAFAPSITQDCPLPTGTLSAAVTSTTATTITTSAAVEAGSILLVDSEEMMVTAGGTSPTITRGWAGTTAATHSSGAAYAASVHIQLHATRRVGYTGTCSTVSSSTAAECVFIDYLTLNNTNYNFHSIYGEQTIGGTKYSSLTVPVASLPSTYPERCNNKVQIDTSGGTTGAPVEVGEFIDQDNLSCANGLAGAVASAAYTIN